MLICPLTNFLLLIVYHYDKANKFLKNITISCKCLPKRRSAESILFGLLVAAITITCARCFNPSMSVNN